MNNRIQDLTLLGVLGKGAFGTVFLSKKDGKNCYFATKLIERALADQPNFQKYFNNELMLLRSLKHINIVHLEEVKYDNKNYYIVMEYINGGSLSSCLKKYQSKYNVKAFPEEIVQYLMKQIVDAVKYIHNKRIIHRDLKLDNIMVSFNNDNDKNNLNMMRAIIKIIDFGISIQLTQSNFAKSVLGSPINMDPVILKEMANRGKKIGNLGYDQKADIWSLGTICYELLIGQAVFNAETMNELVRKVENGSYTVPTSVSKEMVSFLNGMLQYKGEDRLSSEELSKHPFLTKNIREFQKIDTRKVQKKISSEGLNINVKKNKTIWSIFNEEDEKKLLQINAKNYNPAPLNQINPQLNNTKRINTAGNLPSVHLNNINNQYNIININNFNFPQPNYPIYGQNMIPNPVPVIPQYPTFNPMPMGQTISKPQSQTSSYSSGKGGYNFQNYQNIGEMIDLSKPFKKIDDATSNILITDNNDIIHGDSKGVIHVYYGLDFNKEYKFKEFNNIIRCIIQIGTRIAASCNDFKVKVFRLRPYSYEVIKEIQDNEQVWTIGKLGKENSLVIGNRVGYFYKCENMGNDYEKQKRFKMEDQAILNILDVSDSIAMITYMRHGAYFFDFNTSETVGFVPHKLFCPFRCSILKISDHELLIGAEYTIVLIDYKKYQKIKEFDNDASYALYKLSDKYLLTSYGNGFLQTHEMSRDKNGQLELKQLNRNKILDYFVAGIALLRDGRLMIFNMANNISVWNPKNKSK